MKGFPVNTTPHQIIFCLYYSRLSQPLNLRTRAKWARITRGWVGGVCERSVQEDLIPTLLPSQVFSFCAGVQFSCVRTYSYGTSSRNFRIRPTDWPFLWPISVSGRNVVRAGAHWAPEFVLNLLFWVHDVGGTTPFEKAEHILSVKEADNLTSTPCTTPEGWKKRDSTQ